MKQRSFMKTLWLTALLFFGIAAKAQLSFPDSNVLNLNTNIDFLYNETRIFFNTGIYKTNDYSWEKISDSLDKRWFITACFNGECQNDLEQRGNFQKEFGLNDTLGFIAFHVETFEYTGTSVIKYKVYNTKNPSDSAILVFNINYTKLVGLNHTLANELVVFPNPANEKITIKLTGFASEINIEIFNNVGISCLTKEIGSEKEAFVNVSGLKAGIYFMRFTTSGYSEVKKLFIERK